MYSDRDGTATKQSQMVYDRQMRLLRLAVGVLSSIGFGAVTIGGEYSRTALEQLMDSTWKVNRHLAGPLLWPILWIHCIVFCVREDPISAYHSALRGVMLSSLLILSPLLAKLPGGEARDVNSLVQLQLVCAFLLLVSQLLVPRRPQLFNGEKRAVDAEGSSSALVRYSMIWCHLPLDIASKSDVLSAMPLLNYETRASNQSIITVPSSKPYVWRRILIERLPLFVKQYVVVFIRAAFSFGSPYCMEHLLKCLESSGDRPSEVWLWFLGMGASAIAETVASHHIAWTQMSEIAIPVRAQLIASIFHKLLHRKDSKEQTAVSKSTSQVPDVINVVSADSHALSFYAAIAYIIASRLLKFIFAALFLYRLLGWQSTIAAVIATLACFSAHRSTVKRTTAARRKVRLSQDRTTAVLREAFSSIREIKFSSLESQWESHIEAVRQQELCDLSCIRTAVTIRGIWDTAAPFVVLLSALCTYIYVGGNVTTSTIFPMITVLHELQDTLSFLPTALNDYFHSADTSGRIDKYLACSERPLLVRPSPSGNIIFEHATIAWPSEDVREIVGDRETKRALDKFVLQNLNMEFPFGELSIVSGKTGAGKSLLLAGILDEAELLQGHIRAPTPTGCSESIAYVAQVPWLQSGTIQENILFGSPLDRGRYHRVVAACALLSDFKTLAEGDQTSIGQRGVKLSGGQRIRVSFARALYSSSRTLILDDIFSALDTHVSKDILGALAGELCKGRTRILVTHHVSLCLPYATYLVHLENNTALYSGVPEARPESMRYLETETKNIPTSGLEAGLSSSSGTDMIPKVATGNAAHIKLASKSLLHPYRSYFIAAGGLRFGVVFAFWSTASRLLNALTSYLLGCIKSHGLPMSHPSGFSTAKADPEFFHSIALYLGAVVLVIITTSLSKLHTDAATLRAARVLFRRMAFTTLRMPLTWLDATPSGAVLKAFAIDARSVDEAALASLASFTDSFMKILTAICIGLYTSRYTSIATILLVSWCKQLVSRYKKAGAMVKRTDGGPMADILEHIATTSAGIATIRAFGTSDMCVEVMQRYIDAESTAKRHFYLFQRWLSLHMSLAGIMFAMITGSFLLCSESANNVTRIGFTLTFAMELSHMINVAFSRFGALELSMTAISSVVRLTELEIEDQSGNEVAADWPSEGQIAVRDLEVRYAASLPPVLKSISFHVRSGERIGIIGRTGSGKSSLTLSLLRLLDTQNGSVSIDDIDISTIKVRDLRSRIGFIPQAPTLFGGTVRSNMDYFEQLSDDKINNALRHVGLLAEESDTNPGRCTAQSQIAVGGANMSQGQKQLLCLARIILRDPKIIILDEATSAVDSETDAMIQQVIRTLFRNTILVVAHRLETIVSFDRILVIRDGALVEDGTPAHLFSRNGAFHDMVQESQNSDFLKKKIMNK
ncbi:hypothetical protein LMH87_006895 [Akanthomyces muscarius]|uniref:P-loop containing nucleoside triphosphate hydrolase protein n=1 Tax=Akanthomyces muscarius TaxID=2231603 RepID=A0A9W8QS17_AKAMU|nr:hypothetical protein LMH87_006895 [Akanthomyces muscarius]KAJ4165257.1 hypothetical protein LMH87_006895 [Akanthomyces muscarius]